LLGFADLLIDCVYSNTGSANRSNIMSCNVNVAATKGLSAGVLTHSVNVIAGSVNAGITEES
jgi:hypothetical protein